MKRTLLSFVSLSVFRCLFAMAVLCFWGTGMSWAQCGNITLSSQADVSNFSTNYPGCTNPNGLMISGGDITNVNGLASIQTIGNLSITNCPSLSNVDGLSSLTNIMGHFELNSTSVNNLNGLQNLTHASLGSFRILNNAQLSSLDGLSSLKKVARLEVAGNNALLSVSLPSLESVGIVPLSLYGVVNISNNPVLASVNLPSLINIDGGPLQLFSNPEITNITFSSLQSIGNNSIVRDTKLTNLNGLSSLQNITGGFTISENSLLTDISGIQNLNPANITSLYITNNSLLTVCNYPIICTLLSAGKLNLSGNTGECTDLNALNLVCNPPKTYVPDDAFEQALINLGYDDVLDDYVVTANISGVTSLNIANKGINDLTGIGDFTALKNLNVERNQLSSLNVSQNMALESLSAESNLLPSVDLSHNPVLTYLNVGNNLLTSIDLSHNPTLYTLSIWGNQLTTINLSQTPALGVFWAPNNLLTSLDASNNAALHIFNVSNNSLQSLNVKNGNNSSLTDFIVNNNPSLNCIQVDNAAYSTANWANKDASAAFSENCSAPVAKTYVPDDAFEQALIDLGYDDVLDDYVVTANIAGIIAPLYLANKGINDLTGIEGFTALTSLDASLNQLTSIDLSQNTLLTSLNLSGNQLTSINLSYNTALAGLDVSGNQLTSIDLSYNVVLTHLSANFNQLSSIDLSKNTGLKEIAINRNHLTVLDVSNNTALTELHVWGNQLPSLDLTRNTALTHLEVSSNSLTSIDLSHSAALAYLFASNNHLTSIELGHKPALTVLNAQSNQLTTIDLSNKPTLTDLHIDNNRITSIDLSHNPALTVLTLSGNQLSEIDLSYNTSLAGLDVSYNHLQFLNAKNGNNSSFQYFYATGNPNLTCIQVDNAAYSNANWVKDAGATFSENCNVPKTYVPDNAFEQALINLGYDDVMDDYVATGNIASVTSLNIANKGINDLTGIEAFTALKNLNVQSNPYLSLKNQITSINLRQNTALESLDVSGNPLPSVDLSQNTGLKTLDIHHTQLTALDLSHNTALTRIDASYNRLTSINLSNNTALTSISLQENQLTAIDLSHHPALSVVNISNNQLTSIDLSHNPALGLFVGSGNLLTSLDISNNPNMQFFSVFNNRLKSLNMKNGNNAAITNTNFSAINNPGLTCIQVDNVAYSTANWTNKDGGATFSENCSAPETKTYVPDNAFEQALIDLGYDDVLDDYVVTASIAAVNILDVANKGISDLTGIEDFTALKDLNVQLNQLASINISQNTALEYLYASDNQLSSIDLSKNTALKRVSLGRNQLTSLDLSHNPALTLINIFNNQLTAIDLSHNPALDFIGIADNLLTSLDVSNKTALQYLSVSNNRLNSLNVKNGNNSAMLFFYADNNPNLTCIQVDNAAYSTANWTSVDPGVTFSTDCAASPAVLLAKTAQSDVTYYGGNNGSATVSATGGKAPYTYQWAPEGGTEATATSLFAGDYTVTATDADGLTAQLLIRITQPAAPELVSQPSTTIQTDSVTGEPGIDWRYFYKSADNQLILAVYNEHVDESELYISSRLNEWFGAGNTLALDGAFGKQGETFRPLNRSWTVTTTATPDGPVALRFFIGPNDLNDLGAGIGLEDLVVYKVDGNNPYDPDASGYTEYVYGSVPSLNTFIIGSFQGVTYVEFLVNSFSSGSMALITDNEATDVILKDFSGLFANGDTQLTWTTTKESRFHSFEIEKSPDGITFTKVGTVNAKGPAQYDFTVAQSEEQAYYRLKMIGQDLTLHRYGPVITVNKTHGSLGISGKADPLACGSATGSIKFTVDLPDGPYQLQFKKGIKDTTATVAVTSESFTLGQLTAGSYSAFTLISGTITYKADATVTLASPGAPSGVITANGPTALCEDDVVTLTAPAGASYLWSNGRTTRSITVSAAGTYTVTVTSAEGCKAVSAITITKKTCNLPPVAVCKPLVVIVANPDDCYSVVTPEDLDAGSYDPNGDKTSHTLLNTDGIFRPGTHTITYKVTDPKGAYTTCQAEVRVLDHTPPVARARNLNLELDANGRATISIADVDAGSYDNCGPVTLSLNRTTFDCSDLGNLQVRLTITDASGNVSEALSDITISDNTPPVIRTHDVTLALDENGRVAVSTAALTSSISDNCGIWNISVSQNEFTCEHLGENRVTVTAEDVRGNRSTATVTITVLDNTPPVINIRPVTLYLDKDGKALLTAAQADAGSSDNCGITDMSLNREAFDCTDLGEQVVTLTARDAAGNTADTTFTVTVLDTLAPVVRAGDITLYLDEAGQASLSPGDIDEGSSDNCGIAERKLQYTSFDCSTTGTRAVEYTVTDGSGNRTTVIVQVSIKDTLAPEAITQNVVLELDGDGQGTLAAAEADGGSTDNCSLAEMTLSQADFSCTDLGRRLVTLTVKDVNGNQATARAVIEVKDPNGVCPCSYGVLAFDGIKLKDNEVSAGGVGVINSGKKVKLRNTVINKESTFVKAPKNDFDKESEASTYIRGGAPEPEGFRKNGNKDKKKEKVGKGESKTLSAGRYGKVKVGKDATLTFSGGDLFIRSLKVSKEANLVFADNTTLLIRKAVKLGKSTAVNTAGEQMRIYAGGNVTVGNGSEVRVYLHSQGRLKTRRGGEVTSLEGLFVADRILGGKNTRWAGGGVMCTGNDEPEALLASGKERRKAQPARELPADSVLEESSIKISVFPNPASERIHVEIDGDTDGGELLLTDMQGNVKVRKAYTGQSSAHEIKIKAYPTGLYLLKVSHKGEFKTLRIFKE